jgi:hypothetical protein
MNMYPRRPVLSSAVYDPMLDRITLDAVPVAVDDHLAEQSA